MTKNLKQVWGLLALVVIAVAFMAPRAFAQSLADAQLADVNKYAGAKTLIGGADVNTAINLRFTGQTQAGNPATSTGAYVTISASAMTFYQPYLTADTSIGASGVVTYATYGATLGALCDYINNLGRSYICTLVDAKRDDPTGSYLKTQTETNGTGNLAAAGGLNVLQTTSTVISLGITPAPDRRVVLRGCWVNADTDNCATGSNLFVYGAPRRYPHVDRFGNSTDDTYNVWKTTITNNVTATYPVPATYQLTDWLEFAPGAHVVVRAGYSGGGCAAAQTSANYIYCSYWEK